MNIIIRCTAAFVSRIIAALDYLSVTTLSQMCAPAMAYARYAAMYCVEGGCAEKKSQLKPFIMNA